MKFIRLRISDLPSSINKVRNLIRFTNHWWAVLCTCALKYWTGTHIPRRVMYGQWELSFTKCCMGERHTRRAVCKSWSLKLTRSKLNSHRNSRMTTCSSCFNTCSDSSLRNVFPGRIFSTINFLRRNNKRATSRKAWNVLSYSQKINSKCHNAWTKSTSRTRKSYNKLRSQSKINTTRRISRLS